MCHFSSLLWVTSPPYTSQKVVLGLGVIDPVVKNLNVKIKSIWALPERVVTSGAYKHISRKKELGSGAWNEWAGEMEGQVV